MEERRVFGDTEMKRENPYTRVLNKAKEYAKKVSSPKDIYAEYYELEKINKMVTFQLGDLYFQTKTADALGYDTILKATEKGLEIHYVEKRPFTPLELS